MAMAEYSGNSSQNKSTIPNQADSPCMSRIKSVENAM